MRKSVLLLLGFFLCVSGFSQADGWLELPPAEKEGGMPLMEALARRESARVYDANKELDLQQLSNLLWACWGINRPGMGGRTAPSANDSYEMDVYVVNAQAVYLYIPEEHALEVIREGDFRKETSTQSYPASAAVNLMYVADLSRTGGSDRYSSANTGFMAQNVYLYCASEGLGCCVRALMNREKLSEILDLGPDQRIILAQSVGYTR